MTDWYYRLKEIRENYEYSQAELAEILGVDETAISRYEKGRGSKTFTSNFRMKLKLAFTRDEIEYIEYGEDKGSSQNITGNRNNQARGSIHLASPKEDDPYIMAVAEAMKELTTDGKLKVLSCLSEIKEKYTKK